jgi:hypothetical protein
MIYNTVFAVLQCVKEGYLEVNMTGKTVVQCDICKEWIDSPIQVGSQENIDRNTFTGNTMACHKCGGTTLVENRNMKHVSNP